MSLYFPATQVVQGPPFGPVYPMLQAQPACAVHPLHEAPEFTGHARQVVAVEAPTVAEYVPAPQLVHDPVPAEVLYFPAVQPVQGPPFGPVNPALQEQTVDAEQITQLEPELVAHAEHGPEPVVDFQNPPPH